MTEPDPWVLLGALLDSDKDRHMGESPCLKCGKLLDAANNRDGATPTPGALSLCVYCGNIAAFGDDLKLRAIPPEEWESFPDWLRLEIEGARAILVSALTGGMGKRGKT